MDAYFSNQSAFAAPPPVAPAAYERYSAQDLDRLYAQYDQALQDEEAPPPASKQFTSHELDRLYAEYDQTLRDEEAGASRAPSQRADRPRKDLPAPGPEWRTPFEDDEDELDLPDVAVIPAWARANP